MSEANRPLHIPRSAWHTRVQALVYAWFGLAAIVAAIRFEHWSWFVVHFLMLGAVSNALFIWSWHFTCAILRVADRDDRAGEVQRLALLNLGVAGTVIGARAQAPSVIVVSTGFVIAAVTLHAGVLRAAQRRALPSPYEFTVAVYIAACALLVPGLALGATLLLLPHEHHLEPQLVLAHVSLNLLGWVGLPILGTIVTLWPTMLRTRIAPNAALLGRRALPLLVTGVLVTAIGFGVGLPGAAMAGLLAFLAGYVRTMGPVLVIMRQRRPAAFSTWSALAGLAWLFAAVLLFLVVTVRELANLEEIEESLGPVAFLGVVGVLQVLVGCMSYLVPVMAAGGPAMVRLRNDRADIAMVPRFLLINAGAVLHLLGGAVGAAGLILLAIGLLTSLALIARTAITPSDPEIADAEALRVWVDDKEIRPYPFRRRAQ